MHYRQQTVPPSLRWLVLLIGIVGLLLSTCLYQALALHEQAQATAASATSAAHVHDTISAQLTTRVQALQRMADRWAQRDDIPYAEWEPDALGYIRDYGGYQAIAWVDASLYARWMVPHAGNEAALHSFLGHEPHWRSAFLSARATGAMTITPPVELVQGGMGFLVVVPLQNEREGFIVATFRVVDFLDTVLAPEHERGYNIAVAHDDQPLYCRCIEGQTAPPASVQHATVPLAQVTWRVSTWPRMSQGSPLPLLALVAGIALTAALSGAVLFAQISARRAHRLHAAMDEHARTEIRLRDSENRYRTLVDALAEGVVLQTADGQIQMCNASAEQILGLSQDQMMGRSSIDPRWQSVREDGSPFPGSEHPAVVALLTGQPQQNIVMGIHKPSDEVAWIAVNAQPLFQPGAELPHAVVTSFFDITARKQAEEELRFQKTLLECQSEASEDGILVVGPSRAWLYTNRRFDEMWSIPTTLTDRSSITGLPMMSAQVTDPTRFAANIERLYQDTVSDGHDEIEMVDGRTFERYAAPVLDANGIYYGRVWYYRDVSERKAVERLKSEFVSVVSHELRTPLTSIRGALGLIAGGVAGEIGPQARTMVGIAYKNSERLVRLINDILDIEKIEAGKMDFAMQQLALIPLIDQALTANAAYAAEYDVAFGLVHDGADLQVYGDADRLTQVLTNLLSNAAKFSPAGSTVSVIVAHHIQSVRINISDHGSGIPESFRAHIFQKFAQADSSDRRQQGGTGLGLSIVKAIVEHHGGRVGFDTITGQGTTFWVELPLIQPPTPEVRATTPQPARVLICEDDREIARLLGLILRSDGFVVDTAFDAAGARRLLAERPYAAMTLDLLLPDESGVTLIESLRSDAYTRDLPIIVVSAVATRHQQSLPEDATMVVEWLQKPIDQARLIAAVKRATHSQGGGPPRVLHVEDDGDLQFVIAAIVGSAAEVIPVGSVEAARIALANEHFDLIILDMSLPDGSGLDVLTTITQAALASTPVVLFTAHEVDRSVVARVAATLVKSRTSNTQLYQTIIGLIEPSAAHQRSMS